MLKIKSKVYKTAVCKGTSVNKIHAELAKEFNYKSYKNISKKQSKEVLKYLDSHQCE